MTGKGKAIAKGGTGCLLGFVVLALISLLLGGTAHIDIGGAVLLFVIGGVIGLLVNWIYQKGKHDGNEDG